MLLLVKYQTKFGHTRSPSPRAASRLWFMAGRCICYHRTLILSFFCSDIIFCHCSSVVSYRALYSLIIPSSICCNNSFPFIFTCSSKVSSDSSPFLIRVNLGKLFSGSSNFGSQPMDPVIRNFSFKFVVHILDLGKI